MSNVECICEKLCYKNPLVNFECMCRLVAHGLNFAFTIHSFQHALSFAFKYMYQNISISKSDGDERSLN